MTEFDFEHILRLPPDNVSALLTGGKRTEIQNLINTLSDEEHYNRFFAIRYGGRTADCFHCQDFMEKTLPVRHLLVMAYEVESRELAGFNDVYINDDVAIMAGIVGEKYRNRGVGTRLNKECFDLLQEIKGLKTVEMEILYCNDQALKMAEKFASALPAVKTHSYGVTSYKFALTQQPQ